MATIVTPVTIREEVRMGWAHLRREYPELRGKPLQEKFNGFCQRMYDLYGNYLEFDTSSAFKGMISDMIWRKRKNKKMSIVDAHASHIAYYIHQKEIQAYKKQVAEYNLNPEMYCC